MRKKASHWWIAGASLGLAAMLAGCASGAAGGTTSGAGSSSATSTASSGGAAPTATGAGAAPTAAPASAPPHAFAWFQYDLHNIPQIWASVNGGSPHQITHVAPDGSACDDQLG